MIPGAVIPISTATNRAGHAIQVSGPWWIAITPDGRTAYVANDGSGTVTVINTTTNTAEKTIKVGNAPGPIVITP
jgi:YVTN family beta-propeller protein